MFDVRGINLHYAEGQSVNFNCVRDRIIVRQVKSSRFVQARRSSAREKSAMASAESTRCKTPYRYTRNQREGYIMSFHNSWLLVYFVSVKFQYISEL